MITVSNVILISFEFYLNMLTFLVVLEERAIAAKFTVNWSYLQLKLQLILNFCCLNKSFTTEMGFFCLFVFLSSWGTSLMSIYYRIKKKNESLAFLEQTWNNNPQMRLFNLQKCGWIPKSYSNYQFLWLTTVLGACELTTLYRNN